MEYFVALLLTIFFLATPTLTETTTRTTIVNLLVTDAPIPRVFIMTYGKLPQAMTYQKRPLCPTYRRPVLHQTTYIRAPNLVTYGKLPRTEPPPRSASNSTDSIKKGRKLDLGIVEGIVETSGNVMTVKRFEESVKKSEVIEVNGKVTMERLEESGQQIEIIGADGNMAVKILEQSTPNPTSAETNGKGVATILEEITQQPNALETTEEGATQIQEQTTEYRATQRTEQSNQQTIEDEKIIQKTGETNGNLIQKDDMRIKKMIKYISERIKKLRKKKKKNDPKMINADEIKKGWLLKKKTGKNWMVDQLHKKRVNLVRKRMNADNMFKWVRGSWKKKYVKKVRRKRDLSSHSLVLQDPCGTISSLHGPFCQTPVKCQVCFSIFKSVESQMLSKGDIGKGAAPMLDLNLDHLMVKIDADRSGKVDFEEFCLLCEATLGDSAHQTRLPTSLSEADFPDQVESAILKDVMVKIFTKFVKDTIEDMGGMEDMEKEVNIIDKKEELEKTKNPEERKGTGRSLSENLEEMSEMLRDIDRVEEMVNEVLGILEHE